MIRRKDIENIGNDMFVGDPKQDISPPLYHPVILGDNVFADDPEQTSIPPTHHLFKFLVSPLMGALFQAVIYIHRVYTLWWLPHNAMSGEPRSTPLTPHMPRH